MPVHPVSGAFVRVGRRECPKIRKFPPLRGETAGQRLFSQVSRSIAGCSGSYKCDTRGLNAADTALCKSLLSNVANQLVNMNNGLSTLQFQSLSASRQNPLSLLQGGTQDNGTFQYNGSPIVWPQVIYGDGGQSGFNAVTDTLRFNTFTGQANDANFHDGDPTKWVIISAPIISSPEGSFFYPPVIADMPRYSRPAGRREPGA